MNKKIKVIIAVGGTGGHVFPGLNLAKHLLESGFSVKLVTDKRGYKFLEDYQSINISILPSSPLIKKNLLTLLISSINIIFGFFKSFIFLNKQRPTIIFGMGGYASFPLCIAASVLKLKFIIYENNSIIGKANKYLLPFSKKILTSFKEIEGVPKKYKQKIELIGNIIKKEIFDYSKKNLDEIQTQKLKILILGGSQAAKVFAETLPDIFKKCKDKGVPLKIYQHCLPNQNEKLKVFYEKTGIDYEIFNFSKNLIEYFSKINLAITRSGSSMLAELTNANIPFISVPLPSSADNHQFKNAIYFERKNLAFVIEEQNLNDELMHLIKKIHKDSSILNKIKLNQRQFSDKNVYKNINRVLKEILNEKN